MVLGFVFPLALPHSGWLTGIKSACWVCGAHLLQGYLAHKKEKKRKKVESILCYIMGGRCYFVIRPMSEIPQNLSWTKKESRFLFLFIPRPNPNSKQIQNLLYDVCGLVETWVDQRCLVS